MEGGGSETETVELALLRCWIVIRALKELGRADAFLRSGCGCVTVTSGWLLVFSVTLMLPEEATDFSWCIWKSEARKSGVRNPQVRKSASHRDGVADALTGPSVMMVRLRTTCPSSTDSLSRMSTTSVRAGLPEALRSAGKCGMKSGRASGRGGGLLEGSDGGDGGDDDDDDDDDDEGTEDATDRLQEIAGTSSGRKDGCAARNTGGGGLGGGVFLVRVLDAIPEVDVKPEVDIKPEVDEKPEVGRVTDTNIAAGVDVTSEVGDLSDVDVKPEVTGKPEVDVVTDAIIMAGLDATSQVGDRPGVDVTPEVDAFPVWIWLSSSLPLTSGSNCCCCCCCCCGFP